jgi:uncharacterized protein
MVDPKQRVEQIKEDVRQATLWATFEPTDPATWSKVESAATQVLQALWRAGELHGSSSNEAFYVLCDASNNTLQANEIVCDIGVAITRPAEFVTFKVTLAQDD